MFIGYVKDADGDVAYLSPEYAAYATLNVGEMSDYEILNRLNDEMTVRSTFGKIADKIVELVDSIWVYLVICCSAVVVIWGTYIGIRLAVAKKSEQKVDSRSIEKRLVIGIAIMFVLAGALPLLVKGLALWIGG